MHTSRQFYLMKSTINFKLISSTKWMLIFESIPHRFHQCSLRMRLGKIVLGYYVRKEQTALTVARPLICLNRGEGHASLRPNGSLVFYEICSLSQVLTPWISSWGFVVNVIFYFNLRVIPYYLTISWNFLNSTVWVQTLIGAACLIDKHNHGGGRRVTPMEFRFTRVWQIPAWKSESHSHSLL